MIVIDASAVLELLLRTRKSAQIEELLPAGGEWLHAPHLLDVEIVQALRRLCLAKELVPQRAEQVLEDFFSLHVERHPHEDLLRRAWGLRAAVSAYDAMYVALAEGLDAPLVTCDSRLAGAHGHAARIHLVR